uniref:Uncharacterized protein n=1 Tax=viral metagenome TaxID=1070528 RepID=A0A6C0AMJ1_9ZZZZ
MEKKGLNYSDSLTESSDSSSDETHDSAPDFIDFAKRLRFNKRGMQSATEGYEDKPKDMVNFPSTITTKEELPKTTDITTLFLIDSVNRDKIAFPQPTTFSLRLPRIYKNVKSVQLTEVKLLCSFYYFSIAKANIYLPIIERGRESITTFNNIPITKFVTIREGTYNINDLLSEIQTELNYTPLFYDFPNGFLDFNNKFTVSGDLSINFNQPGDTYYDSLNSKYITNPTMATIVSYYWGSRYAGLSSYTLDQLKVAYYYPVLYELLLDLNDITARPYLNFSAPPNYSASDNLPVESHVIFNMSGINDQAALYLINNNIALLDIYRLNHTFRYSLVNRYQVSYDTNSLHVNFTTITLNTSLVNLINNTSSATLSGIFNNLGLTATTYSILQTTVSKATVIYADMFNFLQIQLATLLGISYATYSPDFFNNLENSIFFQNGINAVGIRSNYDLAYLNSGQAAISSSKITYTDSPGYWPNLVSANGYITTGLSNINSSESLIPYNVAGKNFQFGSLAIDPNTYYLNINKTTHTLDILVNILPAQYTIIKFKSPVRQTLQVETLPLPYYYRYSDFNKLGLYKGVLDLNKQNVPQNYFDISYSYIYDITNNNMDITNYNPTILQANFGDSFTSSFQNASIITMDAINNYYYFEFTAQSPPGLTEIPCVNNITLSFVSIIQNQLNISTMFTDYFTAFVYHDRGAFMADLGNQRSENPLHYIANISNIQGASDLTLKLSTFSGHTYYTILRSNNTSALNTTIKPFVYYNDSSYTPLSRDYVKFNPNANPFLSTNLSTYDYVINYNPDFQRLPITSTLMNIDPNNSTFNKNLVIKGIPIGYDTNGVSDDLTDYIAYNKTLQSVDPTATFRIDPLNNFTFKAITPYNTLSQSYFGTNSSNIVLYPQKNNVYSFSEISTAQLKIVQWYEGYSIPLQYDDAIYSLSNLGILPTRSLSDVLQTFQKDTNNNIVFGRGINAIGFLPKDGAYNVDTFAFKSCLYPLIDNVPSSNDPNLQIKYIGVFSGLALVNTVLTLSSATSVLKFDNAITYGPNTIATGFSYGTWYQYINDSSFLSNNKTIMGNTPGASDLLSYDSLFYMVPFDAHGAILTYSVLSGSVLPYPLEQIPSFQSTFLQNQTAINPPGSAPQSGYVVPISNNNPSRSIYGPQAAYSQSQSQYEQSIPITTPSIGFRKNSLLIEETGALYNFAASFYNTPIVGLTTYFSEFSDTLYIVNSTSNICSNASTSFTTANYASSLSTAINLNSGNVSCINYMTNPATPLQNYSVQGKRIINPIFTFTQMPGDDSNITIHSLELNASMSNLTLWMWGGGGGSLSSLSTSTGGAGAYVKVSINPQALLNIKTADSPEGISTLHIVVGKGGNLDNFVLEDVVGSLQLYEQLRYGGGGTTLTGKYVDSNSITVQGGGFSGIFSGSNVLTATPLLIVGGGGGAGTLDLGGPGGFGIVNNALSASNYYFSSIEFNGVFFNRLPVLSVIDVFNTTVIAGSNVNNLIDNNFLTFWEPNIPSKLNPLNYFQTPNTYGILLNFSNPITSLSKFRFYGPPQFNTLNLPTGITIYNDLNKQQVLFSNTSIQPVDYSIIDNGQYLQQVYDMLPTAQLSNTPIQSNAWIVGGINSVNKNIQYSIDYINWIPIKNTPLPSVKSIQYISIFNKWYASGVGIMYSPDGFNWSLSRINNYFNSPINTLAYGNSVLLAGTDAGSMYLSRDGLAWIFLGTIFTRSITRIRFLNGYFWAIGGSILKKSLNGVNWTSIQAFTTSLINDITYGAGYYIISQNNGNVGDPLVSGLIYSLDGINWNTTNVTNFSGLSVTYGNNTFVACGKSTDNTSFIKYSFDGLLWLSSNLSIQGNLQRNDVQFSGSRFISVGVSLSGTGLAANQASIVTSSNGIDWSYSLSGGFDPDAGSYGANSSGYGPITIIPNMTTLYIEIQKTTNINYEPKIYEFRVYDTALPITTDISPLLDTNLQTIFHPSELSTVDVINYPFIFRFPSPVPLLNYIEFYTPTDNNVQPTGITISLDASGSSVIYTNSTIIIDSTVTNNGITYNLYKIFLIYTLTNTSTLYILFTKDTPNSLQIAGLNGLYDPNMEISQKLPSSITDINNRAPFRLNTTVANAIDGNLATYWKPASFIQGDSLKINISFSSQIDRINHIRIFNGLYPPNQDNLITGIGIYTDSTKSTTIYFNNTSINFKPYLIYSIFEFDIVPLLQSRQIYIELYKNTYGIPVINEIQIINVGIIQDTPSGYSAGIPSLMSRSSIPYSSFDGGGGTVTVGGNAGNLADTGSYLKGGSPAVLVANELIGNINNTIISAGGGGGGYYGGGGGGVVTDSSGTLIGGGAGGGGAGYIYPDNTAFTILDYGTASPGVDNTSTNFISPGISQQGYLSDSKVFIHPEIYYGQGGNPNVNSGNGSHGLVVFSYITDVTIPFIPTEDISPSFIDGSKLTVFQAPLEYITNERAVSFIPYTDSIQLSGYSGYNWVWYRSYLSLVGNTLLTSMQISTMITSRPSAFPSLPNSIYAQLSQTQLFNSIYTFFNNGMNTSAVISITNTINSIFNTFQNIYFIKTLFTDASYIEFTEIYCLLDYLRNPENLANPHVNPLNPTLDRILGGIPRFGYWANPFITNASYIGFDVANSQIPIPSLSTIAANGNPVQALYALVLEQSLISGAYEFKDIMAYKPTLEDSLANGSQWLTATQFPDAYAIRSLTNQTYIDSNVIVQPYTFKNALKARLPLFKYSVYSIYTTIGSNNYDIPVQVINDFEGQYISMYSFQNRIISDITSINLTNLQFTSTTLTMNQNKIKKSLYISTSVIGTLVSEYDTTIVNVVTSFKFDSVSFTPLLEYSSGSSNYYNTFNLTSGISNIEVGKAIFDYNGNYYLTKNNGGNVLYENINSSVINPVAFSLSNINFASPKFILTEYNTGNDMPYSDFFVSKFTNIWHFPATNNLESFYGARLTSPYDLTIITSFANQVFYPTHKISLTKTGSLANPIIQTGDTETYPSYQHTEMFLYKSFSSLVTDIDGKFAMEKARNFSYSDSFSGYNFDSYISNINLDPSDTSANPDSFNYLAIRGYSPTESFQSLVRFYLPQRYDYGYITLLDLSNEQQKIANLTNVNPDYRASLSLFNSVFSTNSVYGSVGIPGFYGSNISTVSFGDFLSKFNAINLTNSSNNLIISTVVGQSNAALYDLITTDLSSILPSYLASRNRITDPIEFSIPFSSCVSQANIGSEQYGLGYNLGFALQDTTVNTVQRGTSFFKILDDYIYLQLNEEFNMNRMDISKPENFSKTRDTTAQTGVYNSKLMLNTFGSFATTFVHSPVTFNPPVGKIDKLTFSWYNSAGVLLNNADCEWSGSVQIVEAVNIP